MIRENITNMTVDAFKDTKIYGDMVIAIYHFWHDVFGRYSIADIESMLGSQVGLEVFDPCAKFSDTQDLVLLMSRIKSSYSRVLINRADRP